MIPANRCVLSLLAALAVGLGQAGAEQLPLKVYTAADGLASDLVRCVLADSRGFLWFGTGDGISRFDGSGFTNLTAADGLPGSDVRSIQESRDGTYWAATSEGLFHWDPARLNGVRAAIHPGAGQSDNVRALVEDRSGTIWIATHGGLFRLEPGRPAPQPVSLDSPEKNPLVSMVHTIKEDQDGNLWIGTEAGLFRRSREGTLTAIRTPDGAPHSVRSILAEKTGTVWAGSHTEGLFEVRVSGRAESAAIEVRRVLTRSSGLAGDYVTSLYATADGELWAGCFPGLSEIAPDRKSARSYAREDGFPANSVWAFAEDRDQDLWIGSDHGVMRLARDGFRRFDARDGLASTCVDSLFENREGQLCAFTRGISSEEVIADRSFVECFDGKRFHAQAPALRPGVSFGWGTSQVVLQDKRGEWWVPTIGGLYRFPAVSFASLQTSSPSRIYTETDGLPSNVLYRLFEDSRGDLWVGSVGERRGLAVWLRASDTFRRFGEKDGIPLEEPRAIVEDAKGAVWIGFASGLARYRDGAMSFFRPADGVPPGGVTALHRDLQGRLWIATGAGGVAFVERPQDERPQFVSYGPERGLSSASTLSLNEDRMGRIYVATPRGLDRLDPRDGLVEHFTSDDGLVHGDIDASFRDRSGALWFGSAYGLSRLFPAPKSARPAPPILVTRVFADGVRQPLPDLGSRDVALPDLGPGPAPIEIEFLAIEFGPGGRPRYQHLLEGVDRGWTAASDQRSVSYGRLPAGHYRFRVRGIAGDGAVGKEPAEVRFTILAPFWQRGEVLALAVAVVAGLAYSVHRARLRHALEIERVRTRVATDLHDDIGAGLSEIAILSEVARRQPDAERSARTLSEIGEGARRLVDSMGDIVWSTDPRKDDVASLAQRVRQFAANVLESQGIEWGLEVAPDLEARRLDPETRQQVFLIVKEAVSNAARHSGCRRASIRIVAEGEGLLLCVEDDGRGLTGSAESAGHGLANMRARARSLGGSFEALPAEAGGTRILVRAPLAGRSGRSA
ncbi:MAG TPA: two-component regulator propeller domain-containing protein [Thermoanaerobaculia bacterium]|nr:two-component regulator propeller domain-containing protein [Thermoanaerobaculia bacterium]